MSVSSKKIVSLHYMRGIAAFFVLLAHWTYVFNDASASLMNINIEFKAEQYTTFLTIIVSALEAAQKASWIFDIKYASGGVLLFFLISGFVIPNSLNKISSTEFLVQRAFRILPVVWFMIAAVVVIRLVGLSMSDMEALNLTFIQVFANAFLVQDIVWMPHIDLALWTLLVELKFYLVMATLYCLYEEIDATKILILAGFLFMISAVFLTNSSENTFLFLYNKSNEVGDFNVFLIPKIISENAAFLIFMLVGSISYLFFYEKLSITKYILFSIILLFLYTLSLASGEHGYSRLYYIYDGWKVYLIFSVVVLVTKIQLEKSKPSVPTRLSTIATRILFPLKLFLKFTADVSYPLYLLHGVVGMSSILLFYKATGSRNLSLILGFVLVFGLSYACHKLVELPSNKMGKAVSQKLKSVFGR